MICCHVVSELAGVDLLLNHERNLIEEVTGAADAQAHCRVSKSQVCVAAAAFLLHQLIHKLVNGGHFLFHSLIVAFGAKIVLRLSLHPKFLIKIIPV